MFEATRLASYLSRIRGPDYREWLTAGEAFTLATAGSARVLGFGGELGATAPNAFADLVFLDLGHINYIPLRDALSQLVNGESGTAVMVGGGVSCCATARSSAWTRRRCGATPKPRAMEDWVGEFCIAHGRSPDLPHRHLAAD